MSTEAKALSLLKRFAPQIETTGKAGKLWIFVLTLLVISGMYALAVQEMKGHIVTGMRDHVVWGLYIANFIFFIGISYAGAIISGILYLLDVDWRRPIIRIAELITVIATLIGPAYILLCVGRLDRLHHLIIYGRLQSPIFWDVVAISTYLAGSIIFLYLALIKDFAILRDYPVKVGGWRQKIYNALSLNYRNTPAQKKYLTVSTTMMAIIIIPIAIIVHSVLSWIFGMTLRPGWHSTIFGPYFVLAAIYSGTGVLVVAMWIFRRVYNLYDLITEKHFTYLGWIILVMGALYGYFTFSEYLTDWYGSEEWISKVVKKMFDMQQFGTFFWFANIFGILLPIIVIGIKPFRSINSITIVSALMVLALWVKRYLIIIPTLETPLLPIQDTRPEFVTYSATWVEWTLTVAGVALFFLLFTLASKFVPIVPMWEVAESKSFGIETKGVVTEPKTA